MKLRSSKPFSVSRRAACLGGLQLAAMGGLAARLYYLQFVKAEHLSTQAENNRVKLQLIPPARGSITDRSGTMLAMNERSYQLFLDVSGMRAAQVEQVLARIGRIVSISQRDSKAVLRGMRSRRFPPPFLLKENISWANVAKLKMRALDLPGAYIHTGQQRHYPLGEYAAHVVGHLGRVSKDDITGQHDPLMRMPEVKIGKLGAERFYDDKLRGQPGIRQVEVNANGQVVRELQHKPSATGDTLRLTLGAELQQFAYERLGEESGSVVVMDSQRGDVLALVSTPSFDPDIFSGSIPTGYWNSLRDNERTPLLNKAIQGQYPPGSTFKMLVGLAALEAGKTHARERIHCPGHYDIAGHRFNCWRQGGHGRVNLVQSLAVSCDTYFYTMAERLGIEAIADMARRFGLGRNDLLGLVGEQPGLVPDPEWKKKNRNGHWHTGDTVNVGIGQGFMLATPLQLCTMTARIAHGQQAIMPRIHADGPLPDYEPLAVNREHLAIIREGMISAVNYPGGTAYGSRITNKSLAMAGKTGTSQVKKITRRGVDQSTLPWRDRHHAFFVAYAPMDVPKYALCVAIEHGGGGSSAAAPVAKDIMNFAQRGDVLGSTG